MNELPAPSPPQDVFSAEFWSATAEGRLLLRRCDRCAAFIWIPRPYCPACQSVDTSWVEASGHGTVYSCTIVRKGAGAYASAAPYVFASVELAEGPRVMTNIVGVDPETVRIGQPVELVFSPTGEGPALYRFRPVSS